MARRWTAALAAVLVGTGLAVAAAGPAAAESLPQVSISDSSVAEPATGTADLVFTVSLLRAAKVPVTVTWQTVDDTALAPRDYTAASGRVQFPPGATSRTLKVPVVANPLATGNRSFRVNLTSALNGQIADGQAVGVILDSSAPSYLSVSDTAVVSGFATPTTATFTVRLDKPSTNVVRVRYGTYDQSARAGINYTATAGTLTFAPGVTSQPVAVPVLGNVAPGARQDFGLSLSNPQNAAITNSNAYGWITDSDARPYFTVDDATVTRPATGTATATVTVRLDVPTTMTTQVNYRTANNSAVAGTDYTATAGTLTFAPGDTTKTFAVTVAGGTPAGNRSFQVQLSGTSFGIAPVRSGTVTIVDPSSRPQLSVGDQGVKRLPSGTVTETFTITANPAPASALVVTYATANGNALGGTDYVDVSSSVTFSAGQTSKTVAVTVKGQSRPVGDLYHYFNIGTSGNADVTRNSAYGYLLQADPAQMAPVLTVSANAATVPNTGSGTGAFTITLSPAADETVTVDYATGNGIAVTGTDYTATSGTATFPAGTTSVTVNVPITTKATPAPDRSFYLQITNPTNAVIGQNNEYLTLHDSVVTPVVSVPDFAAYPSSTDSVALRVPIVLSAPTAAPVSVTYATSNGNAVSGVDYVATSGTATIPAGTTKVFVTVRLTRNAKVVPTRYFSLYISNPVNAQIQQNNGSIYILASKATPVVSVTSSPVITGPSATSATFTFWLSTMTDAAVTLNWSTGDGSAHAGTQYTASNGTVTFSPGQTSATLTVPVAADTVSVGTTNFYVQFSGVTNATSGSPNYTYTNIEHTAVLPRLSVVDTAVVRQTTGTQNAAFTVTLQPASTATVTVDYGTSNNSAVAGTDYTATSGTLTFAPGQTSKTVNVPILPQDAATPERSYYLYLSNAVNATASRNPGYGDIESPNAVTSYLTVDDTVALAPSTGTANATFTLELHPAPTSPVQVGWSTSDGNARAGIDYTYSQGTVTFPAGSTTRTVTVPVLAHPQAVGDLGFTLSAGIAQGSGVGVQRGNATGTVLTPQPPAEITAGPDVTVIRGTDGGTTATATVSLSPAQTVPVSVDYRTIDNTAVADRDYSAVSGTLTFAPGQTSATVTIPVLPSTTNGGVPAFYLQFENARGAGFLDDGRVWVYVDGVDTWRIAGKVTDGTGAPLAGATVTRSGNRLPTLQVTTAADGTYSIPAGTVGTYSVTAALSGWSFAPSPGTVAVSGNDVPGADFVGYQGNALVARVVDATGLPVSGVTITRTGGGQPTKTAVTNRSGYAAISSTPDGTYTVTPTLSGATFTPTSRSVTVTGAPVTDLAFTKN